MFWNRRKNTDVILEENDPSENCALIQLKDVSKIYKTPAGEFTALKKVNLCFGKGEYASIMGKSGSGKSTLINMITGIDHPTSGTVRVEDVIVTGMREGKLAEWRGRALGIVFQFFQLMPTLTVLENILLPMDYCNLYAHGEREERAMSILRMLNLDEMADKLPAALSGGQQQIAAIARALANDPPILLADEPTGNLDSRTAAHVLDIFSQLAGQGKTILIVTHDPALARQTQRRVLLSDGEVVDENVALALPHLPHPLLLHITKQAGRKTFPAGSLLAQPGQVDGGLYVISQGEVQVSRNGTSSGERFAGRLGPGQYFSEIEIARANGCGLRFKASEEGPVEALILPSADLAKLVRESSIAARILHEEADQSAQRFCAPSGSLV